MLHFLVLYDKFEWDRQKLLKRIGDIEDMHGGSIDSRVTLLSMVEAKERTRILIKYQTP